MKRSNLARRGNFCREHWRAVLVRQRESGLSIKAFCARERVSYQSFFLWQRRFRDEPAAAIGKVAFAPVTVVAETPAVESGRIEIVLPGNRRVCVHGPLNRQALSDVLAELGMSEGAAAC